MKALVLFYDRLGDIEIISHIPKVAIDNFDSELLLSSIVGLNDGSLTKSPITIEIINRCILKGIIRIFYFELGSGLGII